MGFENNYGFNPADSKKLKRLEDDEREDEGLSRRQFLKGLAGVAGVAIAGSATIKGLEYFVNKFENKDEGAEDEVKEEPTEEQRGIEEEDRASISSKDVLNYNNEGSIEFNLKTVEGIQNNWEDKYRNNPKFKDSFIKAYHEIGYWQPYLEKIFEERGVPKEFIFLAIPESHWQPNAVSKAGAAGPYQFMPKTARLYKLTVNASYDERKDPLASARACADLLSDLYKATKDWNLALSGYNGGFIWEYLKKTRNEKAEISYESFLKFIETKLNIAKDEVDALKYYTETVRRGETLDTIAIKYGLKSTELADYNKISNHKSLMVGQKIKIPLSQTAKQVIFNKKIGGFSENLNYPAKYFAIMRLIKEGFVKEQAEPVEFQIKEIKPSVPRFNFYTAKAGDKNLFRVSKKFKVNLEELKKLNPRAAVSFKPGLEIKIPSARSRPVTLVDIARQTNKSLSRLKFLNPAIKENAPIIIDKIRV